MVDNLFVTVLQTIIKQKTKQNKKKKKKKKKKKAEYLRLQFEEMHIVEHFDLFSTLIST